MSWNITLIIFSQKFTDVIAGWQKLFDGIFITPTNLYDQAAPAFGEVENGRNGWPV